MIRPYFGYKSVIGLPTIEKEDINLRIYPNPTNSTLNIDLGENTYSNSNYNLRIVNMLGKEVYQSGFKNQINVSNLTSGVYILYIINKETKQTNQEKLIIQK
jgi:hypothetical protein